MSICGGDSTIYHGENCLIQQAITQTFRPTVQVSGKPINKCIDF
ncbi:MULTISPECIES: hypothetical protein [unclassified Nostoc]|nr:MULTISPECIES: hypothetical protein [unclassified Nostoc]